MLLFVLASLFLSFVQWVHGEDNYSPWTKEELLEMRRFPHTDELLRHYNIHHKSNNDNNGNNNNSHAHSHHTRVSFPIPHDLDVVRITSVCYETTDWTSDTFANMKPMYPVKYSKDASERKLMPYRIDKETVDLSKYHTNHTIYFTGKTVMPDGFWQGHNPAHFLFPLGILFEWGMQRPPALKDVVFNTIAGFKISAWCEYLSEWSFGASALEAALSNWTTAKLFPDDEDKYPRYPEPRAKFLMNPMPHVFSPYRDRRPPYLYCFEDLYLVRRWGITFNSSKPAKLFREKLLDIANKRYPLDEETKNDVIKDFPIINDSTLSERCANKSLNILLLQRYQSWNRRVLNPEVIEAVAAKYSSSYHVVDGMPYQPQPQYAIFNSFDIMVTVTGSHLTNLFMVNRSNVSIIEVGLAMRDEFWRDNAHRFGLSQYLFSHRWNVPSAQCYADNKVDKKCRVTKEDSFRIECPKHPSFLYWPPIGDCDFYINATVFELQLQRAVDHLCPFEY